MTTDKPIKTPTLTWRFGVFSLVSITILCLDQIVKAIVRAAASTGLFPIHVISGVLGLTFVRNTGAAFSFGEGGGMAFVALAVIVVSGEIFYLVRADKLSRLEVAGLAMVAGGAVGNAVDRVVYGFVTDFIATLFIDFPVFNIADIGITVGVVLALIGFIFLSPASRDVNATEELNRRDEARAARHARARGERAAKMRKRNER